MPNGFGYLQSGLDPVYQFANYCNGVGNAVLAQNPDPVSSIMNQGAYTALSQNSAQIPFMGGQNFMGQNSSIMPLQMPGIGLGSGSLSPLSFGGLQGAGNLQQAMNEDSQYTDYQMGKNDKINSHQMRPDSDVAVVADLINSRNPKELLAYLKELTPSQKLMFEARYQQLTGRPLRADIRENLEGPYEKTAKVAGAGALTGAAIGAFAGPVGVGIGAAIGGVVGGIAGASGFNLRHFEFSPTDKDIINELNKKK